MTIVHVTCPGKIMLAGEYAVLHGAPALATSTDAAMEVSFRIRPQGGVSATSFAWDEDLLADDLLEARSSKHFLISILANACLEAELPGLTVDVEKGYPVSYGFGSSSALTICAYAAAAAFTEQDWSRWDVARHAWKRQQEHQGIASGYDVATQTLGGLTYFQHQNDLNPWPSATRQVPDLFNQLPEIVHVYTGGLGADTRSTMRKTMSVLDQQQLWTHWLAANRTWVRTFLAYLRNPDSDVHWHQFLDANRTLLHFARKTPAYPKILSELERFEGHQKTWTCKTTGAGGEDAVLLFGTQDAIQEAHQWLQDSGWQQMPGCFSQAGWSVRVDP